MERMSDWRKSAVLVEIGSPLACHGEVHVKCELLFTVDKARLQRKVGKITPEQLAAVSRALKRVLSLP